MPGIFRMTDTPAVRMSMACPPLRNSEKRSITVILAPALANQYAVAGPAMDAPTTRTLSPGHVSVVNGSVKDNAFKARLMARVQRMVRGVLSSSRKMYVECKRPAVVGRWLMSTTDRVSSQ